MIVKEYRASRGRAAKLAILSAVMTGAGVFLAVLPLVEEGQSVFYAIAGLIGTAFFGSALVAYTSQLIRPSIVLRIDGTGLTQSFWLNRVAVKWEDVAGLAVSQRSGAGISMLMIALKDVGSFMARASIMEKFNVWNGRAFGFGDAWLNLTLLEDDPAEIFAEASRLAERHV